MTEESESHFKPVEMLRVLERNGVQYVVIGGISAVLYGAPFPTFDLDVCAAADVDNLEALAAALEDLGATEWDPRKEVLVARKWNVDTLSVDKTWILRTRLGSLDVLFEPAGTSGYSDLRRNKVMAELEGLEIAIASISDLIRMKEASARAIDLGQLPTLRMLEERSQ